MLQLSPTSPVQGDNFFGRSVELEDAWHRLEHSHLWVSAPRRVGKTSLLFRLRDQATSHGYEREHYNIDVSPCTEAPELYAKLRPVWSSSLRRSARALGQSTQVSAKLDVPGFKTEVRLSDDEYAVFRRFLTLASVPNGVERGLLAVLVDEHTSSPTEAERIESTLHELALRDGYLVQVSGRYQFRSDFFRRWWRRRYGR